MGCVEGSETVKYKINDNIYDTTIEDMWNHMSSMFNIKKQFKETDDYLYIDTEGVEIYDTKEGFVNNKRIIRNVSDDWCIVKHESGELLCTVDHPFETINRGVVRADELTEKDLILNSSLSEIKILTIVKVKKPRVYSYDVTTESEHFEVSGIYSHNCRSFLSPWKDEKGEYKWEGRFNQGRHACPAA